MHIAIEGLDGVGKSSTAKLLASEINYEFIEKPMHYLTDVEYMDNYLRISDTINNLLPSDFAALFYGTGNYYTSLISKNKSIVTDRHLASTYYWNGDKDNTELFDFLVKICGKPDFTIILYADAITRKERVISRNSNDPDLQRNVFSNDQYDKIIEFVKRYNMNYYLLDTTNMLLDDVVDELKHRLIDGGYMF